MSNYKGNTLSYCVNKDCSIHNITTIARRCPKCLRHLSTVPTLEEYNKLNDEAKKALTNKVGTLTIQHRKNGKVKPKTGQSIFDYYGVHPVTGKKRKR